MLISCRDMGEVELREGVGEAGRTESLCVKGEQKKKEHVRETIEAERRPEKNYPQRKPRPGTERAEREK